MSKSAKKKYDKFVNKAVLKKSVFSYNIDNMKKYHVIVFGCQMNISDAERLAAVLELAGYEESADINKADLIAVVMCSVRQSAVDRVYGIIEKLKNKKVKTILTGCILEKDRKVFEKKFDYVIAIKKIIKLPRILSEAVELERTSQGNFAWFAERSEAKNCRELSEPRAGGANASGNSTAEREKNYLPNDYSGYLDIAPKYSSKKAAYVPIMTGCNNFCSYCVVPYTRDREVSRPAKEIIAEVENLAKGKKREIWLLGQNVNSYRDGRINFPKLLKLVNDVDGDFKLNFTSSHPKDFSDELIETMAKCQKLSMDLNLPIQSGDDEILKKMNRPYSVDQYKNLVKKIRKALPDIRLSTDIIVGFPGETKTQFNNTVKTLEEIGYGMAFINKYSARQGTAAAKMKDNVPWREKKRREKILIDLINKKIPGSRNARASGGKLLVILGPTASGKTDLSIKLAKKYNGEIVSADSRQVYKGLDIGSGKITKKEMQGVPHYLLDVANPKRKFTVAQYQRLALKAIKNIQKRNKLPILVGGTGFYLQSVVYGIDIPQIKPDWELRKKLEKLPLSELVERLRKLDLKRAANIDQNNPRRVLRALEIAMKLSGPVPAPSHKGYAFDTLQIGMSKPKEELKKLIQKRLKKRLKNDAMIKEVEKLHASGVSFKRLEELGLEYRFVAQYLQKKIAYQEMIDKIQIESEHYAKRQMTWFKRDKKIHWVKNYKEAGKLVNVF